MIIHGWALQLLILEDESVGGLISHFGWNSTSEGVPASVPMITWPITSKQFYYKKILLQMC